MAARGRPPKKGLSYHPSDVDFYDDYKIIDLMNEFGPLGVVIYDVIIKMVYKEGYYLKISDKQLSLSVIKTIGNRWISKKGLVLQVIRYCADIGLLHDALLQQNVITSVGIQKRYSIVTVRNKVQRDKYWLLEDEENEQSVLNNVKNDISDTDNGISVTENRITDSESTTKKSKENKRDIYSEKFGSEELKQAFQLYLLVREKNYGRIPVEQIMALIDDLCAIATDTKERLAIVKKATASGWKSFYKQSGKPKDKDKGKGSKKRQTAFSNFSEREYNMNSLEKQLLEQQKKGKEDGR